MPFITSSMSTTISGQVSHRSDHACAAEAASSALPLDDRKCAQLFHSRPSIPEVVDWKSDPTGPLFPREEFRVRPCR